MGLSSVLSDVFAGIPPGTESGSISTCFVDGNSMVMQIDRSSSGLVSDVHDIGHLLFFGSLETWLHDSALKLNWICVRLNFRRHAAVPIICKPWTLIGSASATHEIPEPTCSNLDDPAGRVCLRVQAI